MKTLAKISLTYDDGSQDLMVALDESKAFDYIDAHQHDDVTLASVTCHTSTEASVTHLNRMT